MNITKAKHQSILQKYIHDKQQTDEVTNEFGTVIVYGELNLEKMIERLLRTRYINE
jgi:hypothetical protein